MPIVICSIVDASGRRLVADEALLGVWQRIVAEGKGDSVFYAGGVENPHDFLEFVNANAAWIRLAKETESGTLRGIAWLTNVHDGSAFLHYCSLGGFSRQAARDVLVEFASLRRADGQPLLDRLLGITPEVNAAALKVLRLMGFTTIGTIPNYCRLARSRSRCGGVISYYECQQPAGTTGFFHKTRPFDGS